MEILKKYYNLDEPTAYSSIVPIKKSLNNKFSTNDVRRILSKEFAYSLHKPRRYKFERLKNVPEGYWYSTQTDLGDFQKLAGENDNYKYILIIVDVLSRQIRAVPVLTKHSKNMITAFDELFKKIPVKIESCYSDNGFEFVSKPMVEYFKNKEIKKMSSKAAEVKASLAERALRTLKTRLYAYFEAQGTNRWIDVLDKFVDAINNSVNRTLGVAPATINSKNWFSVWKKFYSAKKSIKEKTYFKVGDHVRVAIQHKVFDKGYNSNFSDEVFRISKIFKSNPLTFQVVDANEETIEGKFYKNEFSLSHPETSYRIERVLKTRKKKGVVEHFVKWKNLPASHNSWIQE